VTILGRGDLAPPRRRRSPGRYVSIVVVVALLAGGGYAAYRGLTQDSAPADAASHKLPRCPKPAVTSAFAPPRQVHLAVYNASLQTGLAASLRAQLRNRGFHVTQIGNALKVGHDVAVVRYSADEQRESLAVMAQVAGASRQQVAGTHHLELDVGLKFAQLRSAAAVRGFERSHATAPSPSPSSSCRARAVPSARG
jgi:hypothetical protein